MNKKTSKKWYKKIWVWLIISVSIIIRVCEIISVN